MVRWLNERSVGRGVKLREENGGVWEIKQVLYADDGVGSRNKRASSVYCE